MNTRACLQNPEFALVGQLRFRAPSTAPGKCHLIRDTFLSGSPTELILQTRPNLGALRTDELETGSARAEFGSREAHESDWSSALRG